MTSSSHSRRSLVERQAAEEQFHKRHYFTKWLQEAGIVAFLDFLLGDSGTALQVRQRAKDLHDRLAQSGRGAHPPA
jgi:hypothetical protein